MLLLGYLAKVQGLKGEFLLYPTTDSPERIGECSELVLATQDLDLSVCEPSSGNKHVTVRNFRWHKGRPCIAFDQIPDRTAAELCKGWALWTPNAVTELEEGESFRHDWVGCKVFVDNAIVGEVIGLEPSPGGYDMVRLKDLRPGRQGVRNVPYIKAWFALNLPNHRIDLNPPPGLLDLD